MLVLAGVKVMVGIDVMETVETAEAVQVPLPEITVYVVVPVGLTTAVLPLAGLAPLLAVQLYGAAPPVAVNVADWPEQILVLTGVTVTEGAEVIETVATA